MKYYINGHTGAGNFEFEGTLEDAKKEADKSIAYTQQDISIEMNGEEIARRKWYGCEATSEDREEDIIEYGSFGFYTEWIDL